MASIYDKASLVLIPSGTKTSKVYSQVPTNGDGDFTFSRSTAATRVNASGNIEKETGNLLLQSNQFDTTWGSTRTNELSGYSGYDGSNDAWKIVGTDAVDGVRDHYIRQSYSVTGVVTLSAYFKAAEKNWVRMLFGNSPNPRADFDLNNGSVHNIAGNAIDAQITSVGSGWYRCSLTANLTAASIIQIYVAEGNSVTSWTGDDTSGIYIQDAQLEQGLVARNVITTTTTAIYGGITDNVPRLDYTDSSCPALLLEPLRTNRVTNSEYLNGTWSENRSILIVNDDTSPEGVDNATKLQEDTTASNTHFTGKGYNYVSGTTYSWSVYAKADGRDEIAIQQGNPNVISFNAVFNFTSETATNFGNGTARIEDAGNGWYRCIIEGTTALLSSGTNINLFLRSGNSTTYTGDGTSGVLLYGFQLEEGSYATSYIPTYGSAVTRNVETCSKTSVSSLIGQTEGTLFAEFEIKSTNTDNFNRIIAIGDGTSNNRIMIFANNDEKPRAFISDSGATQVSIIGNTSILGGTHKIAFAYKANDFVLYMDGVSLGTDTSGSVPSLSNIYLASAEDSNIRPIEGGLKQSLLFKTRLSNEELATLTTI